MNIISNLKETWPEVSSWWALKSFQYWTHSISHGNVLSWRRSRFSSCRETIAEVFWNMPYLIILIEKFQCLVYDHLGGKRKKSVITKIICTVIICFPSDGQASIYNNSLLVNNVEQKLLFLSLRCCLHALTDRVYLPFYITLKCKHVAFPLAYFDRRIYYDGLTSGECLFSITELAQIHKPLRHASASSIRSALRSAYSIETNVWNLEKLQKITKNGRSSQLYFKQPISTALRYLAFV